MYRLRPWSPSTEQPQHNTLLAAVLPALLRRERIELVHIHHWHRLSNDLVAMVTQQGIPVVVTIHDDFISCPCFFRRRDQTLCAPTTTLSTCASCVAPRVNLDVELTQRLLHERQAVFRRELELASVRLSISESQTRHLHSVSSLDGISFDYLPFPGPDTDFQSASPKLEDPSSQKGNTAQLRLVSWGGLIEGKGLHVLVAAIERLEKPVEVHHYGRSLDSEYVDALTARAKWTRLYLHGTYDLETMRRDFGSYDAAVFPSLYRETHGVVVDEALALGLPVLVSDLGAPPERVGARGRAVPAGDVSAMAAEIDNWLRDSERLYSLRQGSYPATPSMNEHWERLAEFYDSATRSGPQPERLSAP